MRRSTGTRLAALAACVALVASCGDDDDAAGDDTATTAPGGASATTGGAGDVASGDCPEGSGDETLTMGVFSETSGLDPLVSNGGGTTGGTELAAIYDTLMRWDAEAGTYVPQVAESLEADDTFTTWTMRLQSGITFGNGDPLSADAVVASLARHQEPESNSPVGGLVSLIDTVTVFDELTVEFTLADPWSGFPFLLAGPAGMITNPAVFEALGPDEFNLAPVGAGVGAFEPVRFAPGEEIVLEAKPDYWGGTPCLARLRFVWLQGGEATLDALDNGELDVALVREPLAIDRARGEGYAEHADLKSMGGVVLVNSGVRDSTPPTTDVRVRQAIAAAIDTEAVDERANEGVGLPGSAIVADGSRWFQDLEGPAHDPDRARELVAEVVAEGEWDGSIRLICDNSPSRIETGIAVEAQLEAVGFDVELDTSATIGDLIDAVIINADFDLACWGLNVYEEEAWAPLADYLYTEGGANRSGYSDPAMDAALDALRVAPTDEERLAALADVQAAWNETVPHVVLGASEDVVVWRDGIEGLQFTRDTIVFFDEARITG
jgi:peptide/nickel transport system substrate-binding protein